ncbi:MAG: glycosyltransferase [Syntrophobacteraceae bacterium]
MLLTIAFCTWNRSLLLRQTLEEMARLFIPDGISFELLVVNNNSTDTTDEVIESFSTTLPIRYLFEPKTGKSHACNRAVRNARGEYILWTDDDVLVDRNWLASYADAFAQYPDAAFFGGPVTPKFEGIPPEWLNQTLPEIISAFGMIDFGRRSFSITSKTSLPFGANFAVRTLEQLRHPFDPSLGPHGNKRVAGGETDMLERMVEAGLSGRWVPDARVKHYIPKALQTTRFIRKYYYAFAEGDGRRNRRLHDVAVPMLFGAPRYLWRQAVSAEIRYRIRRYLSDPNVWIKDLKSSVLTFGMISSYKARQNAGVQIFNFQ